MMPKVLPLSSGPLSVSVLPGAGCSTRAGWDPLMPGFPWLWCLAPDKQNGDSWSHSVLGHPSPSLGKHPLHWQLGTHAPHSTFRERMLSKPHSMMFGQAEVNSILLPWKFS